MLILIINIFLVYLLYFNSSLIDESVYRYSIAEYYMKNLFKDSFINYFFDSDSFINFYILKKFDKKINKHSYNLEKNCSDLYNKYRDLDDE